MGHGLWAVLPMMSRQSGKNVVFNGIVEGHSLIIKVLGGAIEFDEQI